MFSIIQVRRDTAAQFASEDPVLYRGEFGYDYENEILKIGDGTTAWTTRLGLNLTHLYGTASNVQTQINGKAPVSHTHVTADITDLAAYTGFDARYYTETEISAFFSGGASITGYNKTAWDDVVAGTSNEYIQNQNSGFQTANGFITGDYRWQGQNSGNSRAIAIGWTGAEYGAVGYGMTFTGVSGTETFAQNDYATKMTFQRGILLQASTASGTIGGTITWSNLLDARDFNTNLAWKGRQVWDSGNDGTGSGLDADLLDGQQGSYYYPASNPNGYTTNTGTVTSVAASVPTGFAITGSPVTTTGTLAITFDTGYSLPTNSSQSNWDTAFGWGNHAGLYPLYDGTGATGTWGIGISGNAATATSADMIDGVQFVNTGSGTQTAPDTIASNGVSYTAAALFGQSDGALYSQAYDSSWQHQIFGDYRTGQIAIRGKNSGSWQSWRTVLDSSNFNAYAPTLTGTGATGTWGIDITGNAATVTNGVYTTGSYADPSWITQLAWSKITGEPTTLSGYGITDAAPITGGSGYIQNQSAGIQASSTFTISASGNAALFVSQGSGTESSDYRLNATTMGYNDAGAYGWITAGGAAARTNLILNAGGGNVGIRQITPQTGFEVGQGSGDYSHFGGGGSSNGVLYGISFGYRENNTLYRKAALIQEQISDGAARGNVHLLVNISGGSGSVSLSDSRIKVDGLTGSISLTPATHVIYNAPSGAGTETAALLVNGSNEIIRRTLGTGAFATIADYLTTATAASTYQPLDSDLTAISSATLTGNGFLVRNSGTWSMDASTYLTTSTASSTYVGISGTQTVTGSKTFSAQTQFTGDVLFDTGVVIFGSASTSVIDMWDAFIFFGDSTITSSPGDYTLWGNASASFKLMYGSHGITLENRAFATQHSITGGGDFSANRTLNLVNDEASPGTFQFYSTDGSGVKGWHGLPSLTQDRVLAIDTAVQSFSSGLIAAIQWGTADVDSDSRLISNQSILAKAGEEWVIECEISVLATSVASAGFFRVGTITSGGTSSISNSYHRYATGGQYITLHHKIYFIPGGSDETVYFEIEDNGAQFDSIVEATLIARRIL